MHAANNQLMPNYARLPIAFSHGSGVYLYDADGKRYLDAIAGIGVNIVGHADPAIVATITRQAGKLLHTSNMYAIDEQAQAATMLCARTGLDTVYFSNSGAEATECALKLARLYGHNTGKGPVPRILTFTKGFHGRTFGALSATAKPAIQQGFTPMLAGFTALPFNDTAALQAAFATCDDIAAVLVEVIQGEAGVRPAHHDFLCAIRQLCDQHDALFICDEVQSAPARSGRWLAISHHDLRPDIVTLAKGLGGGVPIGATCADARVGELLLAGKHGSTFGGNPLACAVAQTVCRLIDERALVNNASSIGGYLQQQLRDAVGDAAEVRGSGLMIGIDIGIPCKPLLTEALAQGLLINVTDDTVVRLLPPLIYTQRDADELLTILVPLLTNFVHTHRQ